MTNVRIAHIEGAIPFTYNPPPPSAGPGAQWVAECKGCSWSAIVESLPKADQRAELHTEKTGHSTDVGRAEHQEPK